MEGDLNKMAEEKKKERFKLIKEFKAFITKGNILDMAVGVIIGGAFNAIVSALTNKILMPIVNATLCFLTKGDGLYTILWNSKKLADKSAGKEAITEAIEQGGILGPNGNVYSRLFYIDWSAFIEAVLNFFFVALTLFIIIKVVVSLNKKREAMKEEIKRRALKKTEEEAPAEEAPAEEAPAPEAPVTPVNEEVLSLLKDIRDSLKNSSLADAVNKDKDK